MSYLLNSGRTGSGVRVSNPIGEIGDTYYITYHKDIESMLYGLSKCDRGFLISTGNFVYIGHGLIVNNGTKYKSFKFIDKVVHCKILLTEKYNKEIIKRKQFPHVFQ